MSEIKLPNFSVLSQKNETAFTDKDLEDRSLQLQPDLAEHRSFNQVFKKDKLTFGLIAPFKGYPDSAVPDVEDLGEVAGLADELGFSALWVRDVPFLDPKFRDVGQGYDPMVTLGYLAAKTKNIAIGTAGLVSPLREPIHIAKTAVSMDKLSRGRFLLGLSTGDRPVEYPAFKADFHNRAERFRESWEMIKVLTQQDFPKFKVNYYGNLTGSVDLVPKIEKRLPMIAIGRARQELDWLANTADAWIWHGVNPDDTKKIVNTLAELNRDGYWRPFGYANFVELTENPHEPAKLYNNIYLSGGSLSLAEFWAEQKEQGLAHISINLKPTRRPAKETLQDIAENVLSKF